MIDEAERQLANMSERIKQQVRSIIGTSVAITISLSLIPLVIAYFFIVFN
jgi:hypothetical protein